MFFEQVLNESYSENGFIPDGIELGHRIRNRTFVLPTANISIDSNGVKASEVLCEIYDAACEGFVVSLLLTQTLTS